MKYPEASNYINGAYVPANTDRTLDVISPLDGTILSKVPLSGPADLDEAVSKAQQAFLKWSKVPVKERVQVFYRYKMLLEKNMTALSELIREENGKTFDEAKAEIEKSIELTEFACSERKDI